MKSPLRSFWTKLNNFDLWPPSIAYIPIGFYAAWNALRCGSACYFYLANPGIETGGLLVESKYNILEQLPKTNLPKSKLLQQSIMPSDVEQSMKELEISYPIILKPNYGERGRYVECLDNKQELEVYLKKIQGVKSDFILQEYINQPYEVGVFYQRMPNEQNGHITSFIVKEMLHVTGNGKDTVETLMKTKTRTKIQLQEHKHRYFKLLSQIPKDKEIVLLAPIASHNRGTIFIDKRKDITPKLEAVFDKLSKQVKGFYYGRYDIRVKSLADLENGKFKIIELNGAKAEPTHIYDPNYPLIQAYKDLFWHWKMMYKIAKQNHKLGHTYPKLREGLRALKEFRKLQKQ